MTKNKLDVIQLEHGIGLDLPYYQTEGSCCMDLSAAIYKSITLLPLQRCLIPTGLKFILEKDTCLQILPRSGLALKYGITVINSPGIIDSDYRGEVMVCLVNHGSESYVIERGFRIAQAMFIKVEKFSLKISTSDKIQTGRNEGGFGSTGGF